MNNSNGPLELIPKTGYQTFVTNENYTRIKNLIIQVLNEDKDYVNWKLKSLRRGGNMNNYIEAFESTNPIKFDSQKEYLKNRERIKKLNRISKTQKKHVIDSNRINEVPPQLIFPKDLYENNEMKQVRPKELTQDEQFKLLVTNLDEQQTNRFEVFHRTSLNKNQIKRLAGTVTNQSITENIRVLLQAIGKVYVGEIISLALHERQKWFTSMMMREYNNKTQIGDKLKKFLRKLLILLSNENKIKEENEKVKDDEDIFSDYEYLDDDETDIQFTKKGNMLLQSKENSIPIQHAIIDHYNTLVDEFNKISVSVEEYNSSPLLPEHVREAWRLYKLQNDTVPSGKWRTQGENDGLMFR